MPRDPDTEIYTPPEGTYGVPDEIISSTTYNVFVQDLASDLSDPLPIEVGGTGSYSQETALTSLGAISTFFLRDTLVGMIGYFARSVAPDGWLVCNGEAISRSEYPTLFQRIGVTYGAGNLSSTFNLPDLRGIFIRGLDQSRGIDSGRTLGSSQTDDNKPHTHSGTTSANAGHTHAIANTEFASDGSRFLGDGGILTAEETTLETDQEPGHDHDVTLSSTGSEFRPRNVALLPCILAFLPDPT